MPRQITAKQTVWKGLDHGQAKQCWGSAGSLHTGWCCRGIAVLDLFSGLTHQCAGATCWDRASPPHYTGQSPFPMIQHTVEHSALPLQNPYGCWGPGNPFIFQCIKRSCFLPVLLLLFINMTDDNQKTKAFKFSLLAKQHIHNQHQRWGLVIISAILRFNMIKAISTQAQ